MFFNFVSDAVLIYLQGCPRGSTDPIATHSPTDRFITQLTHHGRVDLCTFIATGIHDMHTHHAMIFVGNHDEAQHCIQRYPHRRHTECALFCFHIPVRR